MQQQRCVAAAMLLLSACSTRATRATQPDAALRTALLTRLEKDQAVRDTFTTQLRQTGTLTPALVRSMNAVDSANLRWLRQTVGSSGFPTRAQVGADGVQAAALLVQHADADPAFQAQMLPKLLAAFRAGDVTGQEVAMLTDRVAKAQGRPQVYGTQTTGVAGKMVFDPIGDSLHVDARRAAMGLPSLAAYKHVLDSVFSRP
jgi:hypothetical protein